MTGTKTLCAGFVLALGMASTSWLCGQDFLHEPRPLAPGVLEVVEPFLDARDSYSVPMRMPDLAAEAYQGYYTPQSQTLHGQTRHVILFRNVWQVEFATTGLRQIQLAYRRPDGSTENRHYWYLVYRLRDSGKSLSYEDVSKEGAFEYIRKELRFDVSKTDRALGPGKVLPAFTLEGWVTDADGARTLVSYRDQYLPEVVREIQRVEDPNIRLYDQQEISTTEIPLAETGSSPGVWGAAVWEGVDPRVNYVSVFVKGLTNAWQIDPASRGAATMAETRILHKTLQLNFWRPGDEVLQHRDDVHYGIPLVDEPAEQIEICRRYRLPGPVLRVMAQDDLTQQEVFLTEVDGEVDLADLNSPLVAQLDQGEVPESLAAALADFGIEIPAGGLQTDIPGRWWTFKIDVDGVQKTCRIRLQPQFWEKDGDGIRFIRSLENFWIYR